MATTYYEAEDFYNVTAGSFPLKIRVDITNGQGGAYLIFNGTDLVAGNKQGTIDKIEQIEQWITISSTVKDKLEETNWTSVIVHLDDHSKDEPISFGPYKREVANHLDTVVYIIKLKISKP